MNILNTKSGIEVSDKNREVLLDVCEMVIPEKVEYLYTTLANHFEEYLLACRLINTLSGESLSNVRTIHAYSEKANDIGEVQANLSQQLNELYIKAMETQSSKDFLALEKMVEQAKHTAYEKEKYTYMINNGHESRLNVESDIQEQKAKIESILKTIVDDLKAIKELDINGQRRLDRLGVSQKHLDLIEDLEISKDEKESLKNTVMAYSNMRAQAYKAIEAASYNAVKAYQNHMLLDGFDEKTLSNADTALLALNLVQLDNPIYEPVVSSMSVNQINSHAMAMNQVVQYLSTGTYDEEIVNRITEETICYPYYELLTDIKRKSTIKSIQGSSK